MRGVLASTRLADLRREVMIGKTLGGLVASVLQKKISKIWLIPLALVGFPFLLATAGRLCGVFGADVPGAALVSWARAYGNLPISALGFPSSGLEDTVLGYVVAGILYSAVDSLILVVARLAGDSARRS